MKKYEYGGVEFEAHESWQCHPRGTWLEVTALRTSVGIEQGSWYVCVFGHFSWVEVGELRGRLLLMQDAAEAEAWALANLWEKGKK